MSETTSSIYNRAKDNWVRNEPILLSDYTARSFLLQACQPVSGLNVLDIGCGEGYVARQIGRQGAASIHAYDISEGMIEQAKKSEYLEPMGIKYYVADVCEDMDLICESFDLAIAVFLFNYLTIEQMQKVLKLVYSALGKGGRFIFTVPHPMLPFIRAKEKPLYFDPENRGYFSGRNTLFEGKICRRDKVEVPVRCVHKTFVDYFDALKIAGFEQIPKITELAVTPEHIRLDFDFFAPLQDQPLHMMFELSK
ncbi:MAG: class I SAM-dependent methyltransferase [Dolichospermum sp.]|nr:class I SAM-dependent methyltransferase [Anabaena sp. 49628_E55]